MLADSAENLHNKVLYRSLMETTKRIKDWIRNQIPYDKEKTRSVFLKRIKVNEALLDKYTRSKGWKNTLPHKDYTADFENFWARRKGPTGLFKMENDTYYYDPLLIKQEEDAARAADLPDDF